MFGCGHPIALFLFEARGFGERPRERGDVRANDQAHVIDLEAEWRDGKSSPKSSVGGSRVEYLRINACTRGDLTALPLVVCRALALAAPARHGTRVTTLDSLSSYNRILFLWSRGHFSGGCRTGDQTNLGPSRSGLLVRLSLRLVWGIPSPPSRPSPYL